LYACEDRKHVFKFNHIRIDVSDGQKRRIVLLSFLLLIFILILPSALLFHPSLRKPLERHKNASTFKSRYTSLRGGAAGDWFDEMWKMYNESSREIHEEFLGPMSRVLSEQSESNNRISTKEQNARLETKDIHSGGSHGTKELKFQVPSMLTSPSNFGWFGGSPKLTEVRESTIVMDESERLGSESHFVNLRLRLNRRGDVYLLDTENPETVRMTRVLALVTVYLPCIRALFAVTRFLPIPKRGELDIYWEGEQLLAPKSSLPVLAKAVQTFENFPVQPAALLTTLLLLLEVSFRSIWILVQFVLVSLRTTIMLVLRTILGIVHLANSMADLALFAMDGSESSTDEDSESSLLSDDDDDEEE